MVQKTMQAIASNRRCALAPIVIAIEACSGDAMYIAPMFSECARKYALSHCVMSEIRGGKEQGVPKDEDVTRRMIATTVCLLSANSVCIADDCVAISSDFARPPATMANQRQELASQFLRFRADPKTGQISGKGLTGQNDDLIITFMMALYWSVHFCESGRPDYEKFKYIKNTPAWRAGTAGALASHVGR